MTRKRTAVFGCVVDYIMRRWLELVLFCITNLMSKGSSLYPSLRRTTFYGYSPAPLYGHPLNTDPSLLRTLFMDPSVSVFSGRSRPSEKAGGGGEGPVSQKKFLQAFGPQFGLKIRGASPGSATGVNETERKGM